MLRFRAPDAQLKKPTINSNDQKQHRPPYTHGDPSMPARANKQKTTVCSTDGAAAHINQLISGFPAKHRAHATYGRSVRTFARDGMAAPMVTPDGAEATPPAEELEPALGAAEGDDDADAAAAVAAGGGAGCRARSSSMAAMSHHERMLHAATALRTASLVV